MRFWRSAWCLRGNLPTHLATEALALLEAKRHLLHQACFDNTHANNDCADNAGTNNANYKDPDCASHARFKCQGANHGNDSLLVPNRW